MIWETLASGYQLAEAPRAAPDGSLWFSDALGGGVYRWADGAVETKVAKRRGVGGLALHTDGGVVVSGRDITHVAPDGTNRLLFAPPAGVTGFNDIGADADGNVVAGGLRFMPFAGEAPVPGGFWRISGQETAEQLFDDIEWPNGVGCAADGTVYACDYSRGQVTRWQAGRAEVVITTPNGEADGLALDADGGIWVALGGAAAIGRFSPDGTLDRTLDVPAAFVTSLAFGADGELFVTTAARDGEPGAVLRTTSPVLGLVHLIATI